MNIYKWNLKTTGSCLAIVLIGGAAIWLSVRQGVFPVVSVLSHTSPPAPGSSWTQELTSVRKLIYNHSGSGFEAIDELNRLKMKLGLFGAEVKVKEWLELQVEIIEQTRQDPTKIDLRHFAWEQFKFFPMDSFTYYDWIRDYVAKGDFEDGRSELLAKQILAKCDDEIKRRGHRPTPQELRQAIGLP